MYLKEILTELSSNKIRSHIFFTNRHDQFSLFVIRLFLSVTHIRNKSLLVLTNSLLLVDYMELTQFQLYGATSQNLRHGLVVLVIESSTRTGQITLNTTVVDLIEGGISFKVFSCVKSILTVS